MQRFGTGQMCDRILHAPIWRGIHGKTCGPGIDFASVEVPTVFVGLAAVEAGSLSAKNTVGEAERDYVVRDVGGILKMMAQRSHGVLGSRSAMWVSGRTHGRIADRRRIKRE